MITFAKYLIVSLFSGSVQAKIVNIPNKTMKIISNVFGQDAVLPILYQTNERTKILNAATQHAAVNAICNSPIASETLKVPIPLPVC